MITHSVFGQISDSTKFFSLPFSGIGHSGLRHTAQLLNKLVQLFDVKNVIICQMMDR